MIDIHSHILPGIDDGAKNIKMSLDMLKNAEREGIKTIIATPHFCRDYAEAKYGEVVELCSKVSEAAKEEKIEVKILHGQEIFYSKNIIEDYKNGVIGTLADTKYFLFELPLQGRFEKEILEDIYELQVLGLSPILAHPERYKFLKEDPFLINEFIEDGILFQMNSGSIEGKFGKDAKKVASMLLENGIYNFIGSDAHNVTTRKMGVKEGTELAIAKDRMYKNLFEESSKKLINDEKVEFYGEKLIRKRGFLFFR